MRYKLCLFDLDGTILDTLNDLNKCCNMALKDFDLEPITLEQTKSFLGHGLQHLVKMASKDDQRQVEILKCFKEYYEKYYNDETKPYMGISKVLEFCKSKGAILGVWTNKVENIAQALCETHFPGVFKFVSGDSSAYVKKPNVERLNVWLDKYKVNKEEVVLIGDSEVDVNTVLNGGIQGLFVSYGFRTVSQLLKANQDAIIVSSPLELISKLEE